MVGGAEKFAAAVLDEGCDGRDVRPEGQTTERENPGKETA